MSAYNNLESYMEALISWNNTPAKIINGNGFCFSKGEWVAWKEYHQHNTKPTYSPPPSINASGEFISPDTKLRKDARRGY